METISFLFEAILEIASCKLFALNQSPRNQIHQVKYQNFLKILRPLITFLRDSS